MVVFQAGNCGVSAVVFPRGLLYTPGPWLLMARHKPVPKKLQEPTWNSNTVLATVPMSHCLCLEEIKEDWPGWPPQSTEHNPQKKKEFKKNNFQIKYVFPQDRRQEGDNQKKSSGETFWHHPAKNIYELKCVNGTVPQRTLCLIHD